MENKFNIIRYRLSMKNPNILLIQGWFENNEMEDNELLFLLGSRRLKSELLIREGIEIRKKYLNQSYGIDKEYYFWIPIPQNIKANQCIRVFQKKEDKTYLIFVIPCRNILKKRTKIEKYIDEVQVSGQKIDINGWYVSQGNPVHIFLKGKKGQSIPFELKETYRNDVVAEYPEIDYENIHGFHLKIHDDQNKVIEVQMSDGVRSSKYTCEIYQSAAKRNIINIKKTGVKVVRYFKNNGAKKTVKRIAIKMFKIDENNYQNWLKKNQLSQIELEMQRRKSFEYEPKISIVVPLYKTQLNYLEELIESVKNQTYSNWELCLSDGSGEDSPLLEALNHYTESDKRIKAVSSNISLQISENTNRAIQIAEGEYIAFADHDDLLTPNALYECVHALNCDRNIDMFYSDEDKISMDGKEYFEPHFKTDFNIDLLCSMNYFCHLVVVSRKLVMETGGLRSEFDGAQDYDFVLRCVELAEKVYHIPMVLYHWRAHKDSTAENPQSKMYAFEAGARAVQAHYDRVGIQAKVHQGEYLGLYRTEFILEDKPLVSIIIPNKDHIEDLNKCIESIESKSCYGNYEYIIIENNSEKEATFQYYQELEKNNPKVRVICWDKEFNYSAINNFGVSQAKGEYLLFLNNDTEIINGTCLEELVGYCRRDDVGAVGARLYYSDNTIQHAGVIVGFGGIAGHAFIGLPRNANGYFSRIICAQDMSAVTAACMMVKKKVFDQVDGFDEALQVAFNDIDLCMKIRNAGYLIVYNPYAELYHYESKSRGLEDTREKIERFNNEIATFAHKWPDILKNGDPYYNPNLSMERCDFSLK